MTAHSVTHIAGSDEHDREVARVFAAETWQSYFPDHVPDEAHPTPGVDAVHHHFVEYLDAHPGNGS
jgi:hypothetical protein